MNDSPNPYDAPNAPLDDPSPPRTTWSVIVELLVVVAVIAGLTAWLWPALKNS